MDEKEKNIIKLFDQFQFEANKIWPLSQWAITCLRNAVLLELKKDQKNNQSYEDPNLVDQSQDIKNE